MRPLLVLLAMAALLGPARAGTFSWSYSADLLTLDPMSSRVTFTNAFLANVYEGLVRMDDRLAIAPSLAASWDRVSPTVWRFHLRQGVRFHDGAPFTAADVLASWARMNTPGALNRGTLSAIREMRASDPATVEIETAAPFPILLNALLQFPIFSTRWMEANNAATATDLNAPGENYANRHANGTGPFEVAERTADSATVLRAFPGWWDRPAHNLTMVTFRPIRSAVTRSAALLSGAVDATVDLPLQDVDRVRASPDLQVIFGPELRTIYLGMDQFRDRLLFSDVTDSNPFRDRRVREAIYRAIDIAALRHGVMRDQSWPAADMASPLLPGAPSDLSDRLPFDPDTSRRLLAEAGYPSGFGVALTCPNDRYVNDERLCQAIASMLGRVGIRISLQSETTAVWSRRTAALDVSFFMLGHAALPLADAYSTLSEVIHSRTDREGGLNYGRYSNAKVDALIEASASATDEAKRRALIREAFRLEREDIGNIPLHQQPIVWAAKKGIAMHQAPDNQIRLWLITTP